jgi:hypothetical protein
MPSPAESHTGASLRPKPSFLFNLFHFLDSALPLARELQIMGAFIRTANDMTNGMTNRITDACNVVANRPLEDAGASKGAVIRTAAIPQDSRNASHVMRVSENRAEREAAFMLVHRAYREAGLTDDNAMQMRVMKHHLLDTTDVLVAKRGDDVRFTVSLVRDGACGLPAESLFQQEVQAMREAGIKLAEVSCVASDCADDNKKQRFETLVKMISLTIHVARRRGTDRLLLAVHPRHAKLYQRMFGCVPCTDVKEYQAVRGNPAVLCIHDFAELDRRGYSLFEEVYNSRFSPWQMDGCRMSAAEKEFFRQAIHAGSADLLPMAA